MLLYHIGIFLTEKGLGRSYRGYSGFPDRLKRGRTAETIEYTVRLSAP